jgi:hypothetical protein
MQGGALWGYNAFTRTPGKVLPETPFCESGKKILSLHLEADKMQTERSIFVTHCTYNADLR